MTSIKRAGGWALVALLALGAPLAAQGIQAKTKAVVLFGSTSNTTKPATIKWKKVQKETPEHKTIKSDGVRKGSARYEILVAKMNKRIKAACKAAAEAKGHDCVLKAKDVKDKKGLKVVDLTKEVIKRLESSDGTT